MEGASKDLKRITLELGGNDASIVLPDADVKKVAEQLFWASFSNAGQICVAAKRIYIHEDIYDEPALLLPHTPKKLKWAMAQSKERVGLSRANNLISL